MMTPRLQMKSPCTFNFDFNIANNTTIPITEFWMGHVREMYEGFNASFAANEGLEAIIRDLAPSRRRLAVNRISRNCYSIECEQGGKLYLTATDDDSIILSFDQQFSEDNEIDLAFYDSFEAARFIGNAFRAYRMIQDKFWKTLSRC